MWLDIGVRDCADHRRSALVGVGASRFECARSRGSGCLQIGVSRGHRKYEIRTWLPASSVVSWDIYFLFGGGGSLQLGYPTQPETRRNNPDHVIRSCASRSDKSLTAQTEPALDQLNIVTITPNERHADPEYTDTPYNPIVIFLPTKINPPSDGLVVE
jgi:hypothetical protein